MSSVTINVMRSSLELSNALFFNPIENNTNFLLIILFKEKCILSIRSETVAVRRRLKDYLGDYDY